MRLYNGCPDDELKALLDSQKAMRVELDKAGLYPCYFPAESQWAVFTKCPNVQQVTRLFDSFESAYLAAQHTQP